jgi:hypothetical protein
VLLRSALVLAVLSFCSLSPGEDGAGKNLHIQPAASTTTVRLVVVGAGLPVERLTEALGSEVFNGYLLSIAEADQFDEVRFIEPQTKGPRGISIWLVAGDALKVRLYFADAHHDRYVLREISLSGETDEMDLEVLSQAIAWSLQALDQGSRESLTRGEVQSRLHPNAPLPDQEQGTRKASGPRSRRNGEWDLPVEPRIFYGTTVHSTEIPIVHGPGLGLLLRHPSAPPVFGVDASVQLQLPATAEGAGLQLKLTSLAWRFHLQIFRPSSSRLSFGAELGTGFDAIWSTAQALEGENSIPRDPSFSVAVLGSGGVFSQWEFAQGFVLSAHADVEVDLYAPHFFVVTEGDMESYLDRFPIRPMLTLGVGLW